MNLSLDIGNTHIKFGLFEGHKLVRSGRLETPSEGVISPTNREAWESLYNPPPEWLIYSSVRKHFEATQLHLPPHLSPATGERQAKGEGQAKGIKIVRLQTGTPLPIQNRYLTPETLGPDRLAAAVGAYASPSTC